MISLFSDKNATFAFVIAKIIQKIEFAQSCHHKNLSFSAKSFHHHPMPSISQGRC